MHVCMAAECEKSFMRKADMVSHAKIILETYTIVISVMTTVPPTLDTLSNTKEA